MTKEQGHTTYPYNVGDLIRKHRHGEPMMGLVLEGISASAVRVMWETGTASIEMDDDLIDIELIADASERKRYLIGGNNQ